MDIYYINSDEFLKKYDTNFLRQYVDGQEFKSLKRFIQHSIGRYIVKTIGQNIYGIKDTKIRLCARKYITLCRFKLYLWTG